MVVILGILMVLSCFFVKDVRVVSYVGFDVVDLVLVKFMIWWLEVLLGFIIGSIFG